MKVISLFVIFPQPLLHIISNLISIVIKRRGNCIVPCFQFPELYPSRKKKRIDGTFCRFPLCRAISNYSPNSLCGRPPSLTDPSRGTLRSVFGGLDRRWDCLLPIISLPWSDAPPVTLSSVCCFSSQKKWQEYLRLCPWTATLLSPSRRRLTHLTRKRRQLRMLSLTRTIWRPMPSNLFHHQRYIPGSLIPDEIPRLGRLLDPYLYIPRTHLLGSVTKMRFATGQ